MFVTKEKLDECLTVHRRWL